MNIAVIGANGRSGMQFVHAALAAGHVVRAGVRSNHQLSAHPNLTVLSCDATNENDIRELVHGTDAVVSLIGHGRGSAHDLQYRATQTLINVMQSLHLTRVVSLTGSGVRMPGDKITVVDHFFTLSVGLIDPWRVKDGKNHSTLLMDSSLDWTILRVVKLTNSPSSAYTLTNNGPAKTFVSRIEVASAILTILANDSFIKTAPLISN